MSTDSTVQRRFIGAAIRHYRQQLGLAVDDAAEVLECDASKISRIETGVRSIRGSELETLLDRYGVFGKEQQRLLELAATPLGRAAIWWHPYANALPSVFREYVCLEGQADRILLYGGIQIPELFQTRQYTSAVLSADLSVQAGTEEIRVEAAEARKRAILEDRSASLEVVLSEAALRRQVGDAEVMHDQLWRLVHLATGKQYPWVSLRIVPFSAGATAAVGMGSFTVLKFEALAALGLVHLDGTQGGSCQEQPEDAFAYEAVFSQTQVKALNQLESRALLNRWRRDNRQPSTSLEPGAGS
jgi:transcriptional regulator with XRE-family HTH domain